MKQFEFTTATNEALTSKLDVFKELQTLFNANLKISDYSEIYTSIFMVYQCFPIDSPYFNAKEYKRIRRKTNLIELYSLLDYNKIQNADEKEILHILSETYLKSIYQHLKIKDFQHVKFYNDVLTLLSSFLHS